MPSRRPVFILPILLVTALVVVAPAAAQTVPPPPIGLTAVVSIDTVTLTWTQPGGSPTTYVVEAGSAPGLANLASVSTGNATWAFVATAVLPGNYFVRVRARNASGTSDPSNEVIVSVGASCQLPPAPQGLTSAVEGSTIHLQWTGMSGLIQLEAGSGPGRADLFNESVGRLTTMRTTAPAGLYFVRVRERNACGFGPPSNEITVSVSGVPPPPRNFAASVIGGEVTFRWDVPNTLALYQLEAGSAPGLSDITVIRTWTFIARGYTAPAVPPGTYYVRVRAVDTYSQAVGAPSNELAVTVGAPQAGTSTVTFTGLSPLGDPFVSHLEAGFLVEPVSGPWTIGNYGRPAPFIRFSRLASDPATTGTVRVTAGGNLFRFTSVDLYSSITVIPYVFTGMREGVRVFTFTGTVPGTYGNLATVPSAFPLELIDTLLISVTNPETPGSNPVGLDNIVLRP
jgi:hypothetical protein